jgi:argininosuccinate lyase
MKKLWGGRFSATTNEAVETYTESISYDRRLWRHDIMGSIAHAKMLGRQKIISRRDADTIVKALKEIEGEIGRGEFVFRREYEDIHMNIESRLTEKIGPAGGRLHTARSRNDQVALDIRLYLRDETTAIIGLLERFRLALVALAEKNTDAVMPGYTHLQRAQPVLFAHHLLAYHEMALRDAERFSDTLKRMNVLPLGSAALAGTTFPIDRHFVAKHLGFAAISENSMDAVSDRDFAVEFLSCSAIAMMHLSRLSEDIILWASGEFGFIDLPDSFATGSSIMPQKKNPDVAELTRGKTGRVYGSLFTLLTIMKGLPLAYNRDMQEDKEAIFDAVDTVKAALDVMARMIPGIKVKAARMREAAEGGYATATDLADYLVEAGLPFRDAHEIAGKAVAYCISRDKTLGELSMEEFAGFSNLIKDDVYGWLSVDGSAARRKSHGGTAREAVLARLDAIRGRK